MESLNELELALLSGLAEKYPALASHIANLKVEKREITKTGMCVHLVYFDFEPKAEAINALFSNAENIHLKSLKNGLGYVIDITDGVIQHIEFVTYGEKWNGKVADFEIVPNPLLEE